MKKISVIVPIYNVEKHLEKCLRSLITQTYPELEIILVNDGSKDKSLEICKAFAAIDNRVHVIDKVNEGVAQARNRGLEAATGEYVGFVDPDDWVEPEMYEKMLKTLIATPYEICMCNYYKDDKWTSIPRILKITQVSLTKEEAVTQILGHMIGMSELKDATQYIMGCVWRCLYKKDFLDKEHLRFVNGITIMEDLVFCVNAILKANGVCIDSGLYYHYVQHPKSVLHSYNKYMWEDEIKVYHLLKNLVEEAGLEEQMKPRMDLRYIGMAICAINNEMKGNPNKSVKEKFKNIKRIYKDNELRVTIKRRVKKEKITRETGR